MTRTFFLSVRAVKLTFSLSDVGGAVATSGVNLTLDDAAGSLLPNMEPSLAEHSSDRLRGSIRIHSLHLLRPGRTILRRRVAVRHSPPFLAERLRTVHGVFYAIDDAARRCRIGRQLGPDIYHDSGRSLTTTVVSVLPNPSTTAQAVLLPQPSRARVTVEYGNRNLPRRSHGTLRNCLQ
jgi:hypothetical protein